MHQLFNKIPFQIKLAVSILYIGLVAALSLLPVKDLPNVPLFPGADKLIHTTMYFGLSILLLWTFHTRKILRWKLYTFIVSWGISMEILQIIMHAGRHFSLFDILANITGLLLGIALYMLLNSKMKLDRT